MRLKAKRSSAVGAAALCVALAFLTAGAQEKKKEQPAAEQTLPVRLNALVLDAQGRLVNDLGRDDFQLLEDGVPQKVSVFEKQEGHHVYGLLIDGTGSMRDDIGRVVGFGKMIVRGTSNASEGFVVRFVSSDEIKVLHDVTSDKRALEDALDAVYIQGGQTAINDAVYLAAERLAKYKLEQKSPRRYSLVLVTDGEDRLSYYKDAKVFEKLRESGMRVFVVGFVKKNYETTTPEKAKQYMSRLAFESGGAAHFVTKGVDLTEVARQILTDMSANYLIGYDSTNSKRDGSTRLIQLSAGAGPDGSARKVLVTAGYTAPKTKDSKK
ncbi:MAG TPA: VWA domain-containing protein [Pyrinomonadaceae bacterium]